MNIGGHGKFPVMGGNLFVILIDTFSTYSHGNAVVVVELYSLTKYCTFVLERVH
jgi:hypothetical protein